MNESNSTPPNEEAIQQQVALDWGNRDFWTAKCRYCTLLIELIVRECGVTMSEAVVLAGALMHDNAANNMRLAVHEQGQNSDKMRPIAARLADAAEREMRQDDEPWKKEGQ